MTPITDTPEIQGVYCCPCVAASVRDHLCEQSDADLLLPYTGTALCCVCVLRNAEVCEPDAAEEAGR